MRFSAAMIAFAATMMFQLGSAAALPAQVEAVSADSAIVAPGTTAALEKRRQYRHCACQLATDGSIDATYTQTVATKYSWKWQVEAQGQTKSDGGARFTGSHVVANSGTIDGKAFYDACTLEGAADSTCF